MLAKKKLIVVLLGVVPFYAEIAAKDILLYSYKTQRIEFVNQIFVSLLDSIIGHVDNLKANKSCSCLHDSIVYDVYFINTTDWPLDKRVVINVSVDQMQVYLTRDWKYVSYFNRNGKKYRINVRICCEEDVDWVSAVRSDFFIITDSITQRKYRRICSRKEYKEKIDEHECFLEEDGGTELWFVYEDGVLSYWRGNFCDGSLLPMLR